jgi:hypothetical protein
MDVDFEISAGTGAPETELSLPLLSSECDLWWGGFGAVAAEEATSPGVRSFKLLSDAAGLSVLDVDCVDAAEASPFAAWAYEKTGAPIEDILTTNDEQVHTAPPIPQPLFNAHTSDKLVK